MRGAPQSRFTRLMPRIRWRISAGILGRPPQERDFQRQYNRKPIRCHRTTVSGSTTEIALNTDGNKRLGQTKINRSPTVRFRLRRSMPTQDVQLMPENRDLRLQSRLRLEL